MKRSSVGVAVLSIFLALSNLFSMLLFTSMFSVNWPRVAFEGRIAYVVIMALNLAGVTAGVGLARCFRWAYILTLWLVGLWLSCFIFIWAKFHHPLVKGLIMLLFIFWYCLRPGVKAQFVRAATSDK